MSTMPIHLPTKVGSRQGQRLHDELTTIVETISHSFGDDSHQIGFLDDGRCGQPMRDVQYNIAAHMMA